MKKFVKSCLIIGGICIVVGGGMFISAMAMGAKLEDVYSYGQNGWESEFSRNFIRNIDDDDDDDYGHHPKTTEKEHSFAVGTGGELELEIPCGEVIIREDPSAEQITVSSDERAWNWSQEGDDLKLEVDSDFWRVRDKRGPVIHVRIPKGHRFSSVDVETRAKGRHMSGGSDSSPSLQVDFLDTDELNIHAKVGSVDIADGKIGKLDIQSDVGSVNFRGSVIGNTDVECKVGVVELYLQGKKSDYNYDISSKLGAVEIGDEDFVEFSGSQEIDNKAAKNVTIDCKTGMVDVKFYD